MSTRFNDSVPGNITLSAMAVGGAPALVAELPYEAEAGWDSMELKYVARAANLAAAEALFIARGTKLAARNLWVTARRVARITGDFFGCDATALGMLTERGYKAQIGSAAAMQQVENSAFTDPADNTYRVWPKAQVLESDPTVQLQYIVVGGKPDTSAVGTVQSPPEAYRPGTRSSIWTSLASPTLHYPYGWILQSRDLDAISNITGVWLVTDRYNYQQKLTP